MWYQGKVQGHVVVLEAGVSLPDGTDVLVTDEHVAIPTAGELPPEELAQRRILMAQLQAFGHRLVGRHICLSDALLEDCEELEARA